MNIHSFGCSFVAGNGVNSKVEKTLVGTPDLRKFREENSFTGQLSKLLGVEYYNYGASGSNPNYLIDKLLDTLNKGKVKKDDLIIACFTSPLRNTPEFFSHKFEKRPKGGIHGLTFGIKELNYLEKHKYRQLNTEESKNIVLDYRTQFLLNSFDYNHHFDYYSQNLVLFLQYIFETYKLKYILLDAFDTFITNKIYDKTNLINKDNYWEYGKNNIWTFLNKFNDKSLFELEEYSETLYEGPSHPSAKGHKIIAEELYKFYNKIYG